MTMMKMAERMKPRAMETNKAWQDGARKRSPDIRLGHFDKPKGMGSTEAVSKIKWLFSAEKAGHAGTLDPLASGMLPIALGEATKTVPYVMDGTKVYRFTVTWGGAFHGRSGRPAHQNFRQASVA